MSDLVLFLPLCVVVDSFLYLFSLFCKGLWINHVLSYKCYINKVDLTLPCKNLMIKASKLSSDFTSRCLQPFKSQKKAFEIAFQKVTMHLFKFSALQTCFKLWCLKALQTAFFNCSRSSISFNQDRNQNKDSNERACFRITHHSFQLTCTVHILQKNVDLFHPTRSLTRTTAWITENRPITFILNNDKMFVVFNSLHSLALVPALADFVVKVHLNLQDELQFLVGDEGGQRAVDFATGFYCLPVVLVPQVDFITAGCLLIVVPAAGTLLWRMEETFQSMFSCSHLWFQ